MSDSEKLLNIRHSYHASESPKTEQSEGFSKSDFNFTLPTSSATSRSSSEAYSDAATTRLSPVVEYYKKYEYDEVPVKDSDSMKYAKLFQKGSLTNSDLDNLEKRIYKNVSQELQTDGDSLSSLESNIKFFKTTVEKIFANFYTSMRDFDHYKKRFHEILNKSKEGSVDDMEDFIKDMFEHIMSSDNSATKISRPSVEIAVTDLDNREICVSSCGDSCTERDIDVGFVEAYKNQHYLTDTFDENSSKTKRSSRIDERFNIFLLSGSPCLEIKLDGRHLLSEINVKEPTQITTESIASADNLKKVAAKRLELEKYIRETHDYNNMPDRDIPVKVSNAKKNIYLNEDFACIIDNNEASKSFLSKICNILCRKFRKTF